MSARIRVGLLAAIVALLALVPAADAVFYRDKVVLPAEPEPDADGDGVSDTSDNCPDVSNPDQADNDADGLGNPCDPDDDNDGRADTSDNCPTLENPGQSDLDRDARGDACDPDDDNDGVADNADNCPMLSNADQVDADRDLVGKACDSDDRPRVGLPPPPPLIVGVNSSNGSFAPRRRSTAAVGRTSAKDSRRGTVFSFILDRAASVTVAIQRRTTGPRRARWLTAHTLRRQAHAGLNRVPYTGRVRGKALKRGRYRALFTATDSGVQSRARKVGFRIVKP